MVLYLHVCGDVFFLCSSSDFDVYTYMCTVPSSEKAGKEYVNVFYCAQVSIHRPKLVTELDSGLSDPQR